MKKMYGVNTPLSTPMLPDQQVDYASLRNLCDYLIDKGVNGLYPNGSTGEVAYLTAHERKNILECCVKASDRRVPVFSMVGAPSTRETIELAQHAQACGADGIGIVTPYYFRLDEDELCTHFISVAKSVSADFPIYLYGIPQLAVNDTSPAMVQRVAGAAPNVIGIKYSYPDMPRLMQFLSINNGRFSVLAGPDDLFFLHLCAGGHGVISGNSNVIPEHYVAIYDAFLKGEYDRARNLQRKVNGLIDWISGPNHMARYKVCLKRRGIIDYAAVRSPLRMLAAEEEEELIRQIEARDYLDPTRFYA